MTLGELAEYDPDEIDGITLQEFESDEEDEGMGDEDKEE